MVHPRQIIRQTIVEMIKAGSTDADNRVYDSRDFNLSTSTTPAIVVRTAKERLDDSEQQDFGLRRRIMTVTVECCQKADGSTTDVDNMAWQVENIIHADPVLKRTVECCRLLDTSIDLANDGTFYVAALNFEVIYCTHSYQIDGQTPVSVLIGFDPETGHRHEVKYIGKDDLNEMAHA